MGTPIGLKALIDAIKVAPGANVYANDPGSINEGTMGSPIIDYVEGDLTLTGGSTGWGILVVTGTLVMGGNFSWNGPIFVVGDGGCRSGRRRKRRPHRLRRRCENLGRLLDAELADCSRNANCQLEWRRY